MNWYAVRIVILVACVVGTVVSFACTMAYLEHGPGRTAAWLALPTVALFAADALLIGSVCA